MTAAIFEHIPHWVFVLFLVLLALGIRQARPRSLSLRRTAVVPALLVGLSFLGTVSAFGEQAPALLAWATGLGLSLLVLRGRVDTSSVRFIEPEQRFEMPGSWVPLALMMGLFAVKFLVGMTLALQPEARHAPAFMGAVSAAYGAFSGLFLGRAVALWALARPSMVRPQRA